MQFIAHIRKKDKQVQTVEEHLIETKRLSEIYGEKIGVKHITGLAGMLHDLGKYTNEFREYILEAVNNPDIPSRRGKVDHSTAGGKFLYEFFHIPKKNLSLYKGLIAEVVGNAIISHHSYLHDFLNPSLESNYLHRVKEKELHEFNMTIQSFFEKVIFHLFLTLPYFFCRTFIGAWIEISS
ncbi:CRISPR-associated endonuclease Cas3'' [Garciella nitratireducens]|uniref:CRISPR-associated endonuclease Cas3-HD n=1 Tax=Garciella nitratireducens DSM 15102 TaxID=1121911 RepID=A0A1T4NX66_9FIRM|nr:CRISPR-associated endonuclease Cas3'' [Garciella nitratireducens]SJZ83805.1 CRISPR-associated endonuclease Cas3-HD [Garciella nitratireducens DSM 15102]